VPLGVAREDNVHDHRAELEQFGLQMGVPRRAVVRLRARVGSGGADLVLGVVGGVGYDPATLRLYTGAHGVWVGPVDRGIVLVRAHLCDRERVPVVPADDVVAP
jgi:hypothetical protein